jgi:murein DD-endopeptidase MepM/ murein hydrolase activator NlpD
MGDRPSSPLAAVLLAIVGFWVIAQATAGRLGARLVSYRPAGAAAGPDRLTSTPASSSPSSSTGGWVWPVHGPVTQAFGAGNDHDKGGHPGLDIGVGTGTPTAAAHAGRVIQAGWNDGYGNSVTIEFAGVTVLVGHLSRVDVRIGQDVTAGTVVGLSGSTGHSTGPHVHVEIHDHGRLVNPATMIGGAP